MYTGLSSIDIAHHWSIDDSFHRCLRAERLTHRNPAIVPVRGSMSGNRVRQAKTEEKS